MAQPIDIPFGLWNRMGPMRNHALDGGVHWRRLANTIDRPCTAAMRPFSNYFDHFFLILVCSLRLSSQIGKITIATAASHWVSRETSQTWFAIILTHPWTDFYTFRQKRYKDCKQSEGTLFPPHLTSASVVHGKTRNHGNGIFFSSSVVLPVVKLSRKK